MNCIIVDDDKLSVRILEEFIRKSDGIELVRSFPNAIDAINYLKHENDVHLVFLDIEMPDMNGIEFLNSLKNPIQIVIFSSKEKYALNAFDYDVTDFLLKPVTYSRFFRAIDKASNRFERNKINTVGKDEIFVKKNSGLVRLKYDDILWVEALENYVIINTFKEKFTIHFTMKAIENKLPSAKFSRIHRSFIVNISSIYVIEDNSVVIKSEEGAKTIPIGKSFKEKLMKDINVILK